MKVVCGSIEEFCDELRAEAEDGRIINGVVRLRIERVPDQVEQVTFQVAFMATALIGKEHPEYLLEFVGWSGPDGGRAGETGTKEAERWRDAVKAIVDSYYGGKLRKGMLELA